ncbi:MAG: hypothetical protein RL885_27400 [Planctomycetota bacterium]
MNRFFLLLTAFFPWTMRRVTTGPHNRARHWCSTCYEGVCTDAAGGHCADCRRCARAHHD